jgi:ribosomal protein S19
LIVSGLVGKKIKIYNGKSNYYFFIKSGMINHKFGEFSVTKVLGQKIALRKRLKQKKKKLIKKKKK